MVKIIDNIKRVHNGFPESSKQSKLLETLKDHAIAAMIAGLTSPAARTYMSMFADNEEQINLLTNPNDVDGMPWLHETQAYLMANAICTPITDGQTGNGIFDRDGEAGLRALDGTLSADVQESVVASRPEAFRDLFPLE